MSVVTFQIGVAQIGLGPMRDLDRMGSLGSSVDRLRVVRLGWTPPPSLITSSPPDSLLFARGQGGCQDWPED